MIDCVSAHNPLPMRLWRLRTALLGSLGRRRFAEYDEVPASVLEFLETASRAR